MKQQITAKQRFSAVFKKHVIINSKFITCCDSKKFLGSNEHF